MRLISIDQLREGMRAGDDIYDEYNRLLLGRGAPIRRAYVARLREMGLPALYVQDDDTADIQVPKVIAPATRARALKNLTDNFSAITRAAEGFRKLSIEEAHQNIQSKKFMDTFKSLTHNQGIDRMVGDVNTMIDQLMNRDVIVGLNSIKTHDNYTFQHSIDVTIMGVLLARKLGWSEERLKEFGVGCLLHDLGKIFVETEILNKPGRLSDEEFERMKAHPTMGYEMVKAIAPGMSHLIAHVAFQHHERQDGSGYPRGIQGNNTLGEHRANTIHDFGAVAAVADIYDAMASDRPYRSGWPPDRVVGLIRELSGTHLNSRVVEVFLKTVAPYPIGTNVRVLDGPYEGYEGVVADVDDRVLERPKVRLLFDPEGNRIDAVEIDLQAEPDVSVESVRGEAPKMEPLGSSKTLVAPGEVTCPACGQKASGKFCSECGAALVS